MFPFTSSGIMERVHGKQHWFRVLTRIEASWIGPGWGEDFRRGSFYMLVVLESHDSIGYLKKNV